MTDDPHPAPPPGHHPCLGVFIGMSTTTAENDASDDESDVTCAECDGPVADSARYTAADWGVCEDCWGDLSATKRDEIIDGLPDRDETPRQNP